MRGNMAARPRTVDVPLSEVALSVQIPVVDDGLSAFSGAWTRKSGTFWTASRGANYARHPTLTGRWRQPGRQPTTHSKRPDGSICASRNAITCSFAREGRKDSLPDAAGERHPQVRVRTIEREQWMNRVAGRDQPWKTCNKLVEQPSVTRQDALRSQPQAMETFRLGTGIPVDA